jgi:hypothetical protein
VCPRFTPLFGLPFELARADAIVRNKQEEANVEIVSSISKGYFPIRVLLPNFWSVSIWLTDFQIVDGRESYIKGATRVDDHAERTAVLLQVTKHIFRRKFYLNFGTVEPCIMADLKDV